MEATIEQRIKEAIKDRWRSVQDSDRHHRRASKVARLFPGLTPSTFNQRAVVEALQSETSQLYKPSTINKYLSVLSGLGFKVEFETEQQEEARVLSTEELNVLDCRVRDSGAPPEILAKYAILRDSGCRGDAELRRLRMDKVDFQRKTFQLTCHKGKRRTRIVPLTQVTEKALAWYAHSGIILPTPGAWYSWWLKVRLDKANKPYDLRHTFCSRLLRKGVPPVTVQRIMGHSTLEQTLHYYHWTSEALDGVREALQLE